MSQGVRRALGLIVFCLCLPAIFPAGLAAAPTPQVVAAGQVLRGHFVQDRQLAGFAKPLRSEGSFALVPGRGLIWRGEKPFPNTTIISSAGILQVVNGQPAVHLPASRLPGLNHLYAALGAAVSGNIGPLQQAFAVTQSSNDTGWRVVLKPLHPENPVMTQLKSMTLTGNRFVESVEVDRSGGDTDRITFSGHQISNADLSPDETSLLEAVKK